MQWTVYILECRDGSYYVGMSSDLETRLKDHQSGKSCHTSKRLPVKLRYQEASETKATATKRERQIKKWSREKKTALIMGDPLWLKTLARCRGLYTAL